MSLQTPHETDDDSAVVEIGASAEDTAFSSNSSDSVPLDFRWDFLSVVVRVDSISFGRSYTRNIR